MKWTRARFQNETDSLPILGAYWLVSHYGNMGSSGDDDDTGGQRSLSTARYVHPDSWWGYFNLFINNTFKFHPQPKIFIPVDRTGQAARRSSTRKAGSGRLTGF